MARAEKIAEVERLKEAWRRAQAVVLAEYRGLKVSEISEIRREIRKNTGSFQVVKNRLARRAVTGLPFQGLVDSFRGPLAVVATEGDVGVFKILTRFTEAFPALKIKSGYFDGRILSPSDMSSLARLSSREEMLHQMLSSLLAPATNTVRVLQAVPEKLVRVLKAISEKA